MILRPYQSACLGDALAFYSEIAEADERGTVRAGAERRRLYAAPTGTGKGAIASALLARFREAGISAYVVTPSLEIARGFLANYLAPGVALPDGEEALFAMGMGLGIGTPTRVMNRAVDGRLEVPDVWIVDEVHHATLDNEVSGCNFNLAPASVWFGFTATPYRGSPQGTRALRDAWGDPYSLLSYPEAVAEGACVVPTVEIVPLIDDDLIRVVGGEFQEKDAGKAVVSKVDALAAIVGRYATGPVCGRGNPKLFDVPTMVSVPSTDCVGELVSALDRLGIDAHPLTQATSPAARLAAFAACKARTAALVQIKVVSEGVDLPWLGRLVDARPMVSPVAWLQQLGRLTRPGHGLKHYVACNRNVERHAYLLQGAIPREAVAAAQAAFGSPSKRAAGRIVGLESLGRLKPIPLPLAGGVTSQCYVVFTMLPDGRKREYTVIHDPTTDDPIIATRVNDPRAGMEGDRWGRWERCELPEGFVGYATSPWRAAASEKQTIQWKRHAKRLGLDPDAEVTSRQVNAMYALLHTSTVVAVGADE